MSEAEKTIDNYIILSINRICQLFDEELFNIRKDLVKAGNGDMFMQETLKGCAIEHWYMNSDNEIYVVFKNGDVLKSEVTQNDN